MNRYTPLLLLLAACYSTALADSPRLYNCSPKSWTVCADGDCQSGRGKMTIVLMAGENSVPTKYGGKVVDKAPAPAADMSTIDYVELAKKYGGKVVGSAPASAADMAEVAFEQDQLQEALVSRCDESGCTTLVVEVVESGVMLKAASAKSGYLLVINTLDGAFTEIATLLTTAFIKSGVCVR